MIRCRLRSWWCSISRCLPLRIIHDQIEGRDSCRSRRQLVAKDVDKVETKTSDFGDGAADCAGDGAGDGAADCKNGFTVGVDDGENGFTVGAADGTGDGAGDGKNGFTVGESSNFLG